MNESEFYEKVVGLLKGDSPSYYDVMKATYSNIVDRKESGDFNVFIPVRGRKDSFGACVSCLKRAADRSGLKLSIIVIENDFHPNLAEISSYSGLDYIFIPISASYSDGTFAKSLCYNIGFMKAHRTKWNLFFGVDYLVEDTFFEKVLQHLSYDPNWLQPYRAHTLLSLGEIDSKKIIESGKANLSDFESQATPTLRTAGPIIVRDSDFIDVGGYDPEIFYGGAKSDLFFWTKLELKYKDVQGDIKNNVMDNGSFANDPPINLYHLHHEPEEGARDREMNAIYKLYVSLESRRRQHIIGLKKLIFNQFYSPYRGVSV